jgi:hypothetical protein
MFYLSKDKSKILDGRKLVVGYIRGGNFSQTQRNAKDEPCCKDYTDRGLTAMQLEHISELLQKSTGQFI